MLPSATCPDAVGLVKGLEFAAADCCSWFMFFPWPLARKGSLSQCPVSCVLEAYIKNPPIFRVWCRRFGAGDTGCLKHGAQPYIQPEHRRISPRASAVSYFFLWKPFQSEISVRKCDAGPYSNNSSQGWRVPPLSKQGDPRAKKAHSNKIGLLHREPLEGQKNTENRTQTSD